MQNCCFVCSPAHCTVSAQNLPRHLEACTLNALEHETTQCMYKKEKFACIKENFVLVCIVIAYHYIHSVCTLKFNSPVAIMRILDMCSAGLTSQHSSHKSRERKPWQPQTHFTFMTNHARKHMHHLLQIAT